MGTSAPPAPGGEAPAAGAAVPAAPVTPVVSAVQAAVDKARMDATAAAAPAAPAAPPANETPEQKTQRESDEAVLAAMTPELKAEVERLEAEEAARLAAETPEQKAAREAAAAAPVSAELVVKLGGRRDGDPEFEVEFDSKDIADAVRAEIRGAIRAEQAHAIRDQAQALRDEADAIHYEVELDPAGVLTQLVRHPDDLDHLFRFIATRPGVLERTAEWVAGLIEEPTKIKEAAKIEGAERLERRERVSAQVAERREVDDNARAILRTTQKSIESLAPDTFNDDQRATLYKHTLGEIREYARAKNLLTIDPRTIPGFVQRVLASYGVAPRTAKQPSAAAAPAGTKVPVASAPQPTVEQIRQARARRNAAASAPPGAGSPAPGALVKSAPYDPKNPRSAIQQAADGARRIMGIGRQRPR